MATTKTSHDRPHLDEHLHCTTIVRSTDCQVANSIKPTPQGCEYELIDFETWPWHSLDALPFEYVTTIPLSGRLLRSTHQSR